MKKGFTLIELLVVILIIGILSAIALPKYRVAIMKTRFMELFITGKFLMEAQKLYYTANGQYADTFDELEIPFGTVSQNKRSFSNSKIYCQRASNAEIQCKHNLLGDERENLLMVENYSTRKIYCRACNDLTKQVCIASGGTWANSSACENYIIYEE